MKLCGPYRIVRLLGRGGFAEVYEAHPASDEHQRVALKRLLDGYSEDELRALQNEAELASTLQHPNIVQVLDFGVMDERPFLALEFVDGLSLAKLLEQAKPPMPIALDIARTIAEALRFVHEREVFHRDISPENVLIGWDGAIKLTDFGIAKWRRLRPESAARLVGGKIDFMAPEARSGSADARSDLYGLGQVLRLMLEQDDLSDLVNRATAPFPDDRFQSAQAMIDALQAVRRELASSEALEDWLEENERRTLQAKHRAIAELVDFDLVLEEATGNVRRYTSVPEAARVEAPLSDGLSAMPAFSSERSITRVTRSVWARLAISGTTPPKAACRSNWVATSLLRISRGARRTPAAVSSHEVSMPRTSIRRTYPARDRPAPRCGDASAVAASRDDVPRWMLLEHDLALEHLEGARRAAASTQVLGHVLVDAWAARPTRLPVLVVPEVAASWSRASFVGQRRCMTSGRSPAPSVPLARAGGLVAVARSPW